MIPSPTPIPGCHVIDLDRREDERGFFARTWDRVALEKFGLDVNVALIATTFNKLAGTLRGMHMQAEPFAETKLIRVTRGAIFDVCLDVRPVSPTYLKWHGETLSADNRRQLYIPKGCAHGYLTLEDSTEMNYVLSAGYAPDHQRGFRYDDPAFAIKWPGEVKVIHPRDAGYALMDA